MKVYLCTQTWTLQSGNQSVLCISVQYLFWSITLFNNKYLLLHCIYSSSIHEIRFPILWANHAAGAIYLLHLKRCMVISSGRFLATFSTDFPAVTFAWWMFHECFVFGWRFRGRAPPLPPSVFKATFPRSTDPTDRRAAIQTILVPLMSHRDRGARRKLEKWDSRKNEEAGPTRPRHKASVVWVWRHAISPRVPGCKPPYPRYAVAGLF